MRRRILPSEKEGDGSDGISMPVRQALFAALLLSYQDNGNRGCCDDYDRPADG